VSTKFPRRLQLLNHQRHAIIDRKFRGAPASGDDSRIRRIEAALDCWERKSPTDYLFFGRLDRARVAAARRLAEIQREVAAVSSSPSPLAVETRSGVANG
jgi:hypothetical protein